jgi:hypothetical protein
MCMRGERDSTKPASRSSAQDQIGGSIGVTEMMIGKWYDPISQRWIVPREARPVAGYSQSNPERGPETRASGDAERIWDLLVDCCARG